MGEGVAPFPSRVSIFSFFSLFLFPIFRLTRRRGSGSIDLISTNPCVSLFSLFSFFPSSPLSPRPPAAEIEYDQFCGGRKRPHEAIVGLPPPPFLPPFFFFLLLPPSLRPPPPDRRKVKDRVRKKRKTKRQPCLFFFFCVAARPGRRTGPGAAGRAQNLWSSFLFFSFSLLSFFFSFQLGLSDWQADAGRVAEFVGSKRNTFQPFFPLFPQSNT